MKFVRVTMPDQSQYDVPMQVLKEKLADKYATKKAEEAYPGSKYKPDNSYYMSVYEEEYKDHMYSLDCSRESEVLEEAKSLYWKSDVEPYAVRVTKAEKVDLVNGWTTGDKEIVEK